MSRDMDKMRKLLAEMKASGVTVSYTPAPGHEADHGESAMALMHREAQKLGMTYDDPKPTTTTTRQDETDSEGRVLPIQVEACVTGLRGMGYDDAATSLREQWFGPKPSPRYVATFWSEDPARGVLLDERKERFAFFPSLERAEVAASRLSDDDEPPYFWRSNVDGEPIYPWPDNDDYRDFESAASEPTEVGA